MSDDTRIDATPQPPYRGYTQCSEQEARAQFAARFGAEPAECWTDAALVWHAGPVPS